MVRDIKTAIVGANTNERVDSKVQRARFTVYFVAFTITN